MNIKEEMIVEKLLTRQQRRQQKRQQDKKIAKVMNRTFSGEELQEAIERTMAQAFVMMQSMNKEALRLACENTKGIGPDRQESLQTEFAKNFETVVNAELKKVNDRALKEL